MRRRHLSFVLLLVLCGSFLSAAYAEKKPRHLPKRDMKQQVEDLEQQWRTATMTGDVGTLDRLLSDDYVGISMSGQVNTKVQQLDRLRNRVLLITRLDLSDVQVKLVGTVAIVTSLASVEGTNDGNSMTGVYRYTRVYQHLPTGAWKITNFEATRVPQNRPGGPPPLQRPLNGNEKSVPEPDRTPSGQAPTGI